MRTYTSTSKYQEHNDRFEDYVFAFKAESLGGTDGKFPACKKLIIYDEDEGCGDMDDALVKTADGNGDIVSLARAAAAASAASATTARRRVRTRRRCAAAPLLRR